MQRTLLLLLFLFSSLLPLSAQVEGQYPAERYHKREVYIPMRDGTRLFTAIYTPKDTTRQYPFLLNRTPYSVAPYGEGQYKEILGPNRYLMQDGYIFVYQDVRGRWMSEGDYDNMRPHVRNKQNNRQIDESSDTYDTIEWLLANVRGHNGRAGIWGISYPGFYATAASVDAHPALVAASPQASIGDFYFDDFHHNGAYLLSYWMATAVFGYQNEEPTTEAWYEFPEMGTPDAYQFFLDAGPLSNLDSFYRDNFFWQQLRNHPDYDEFWQQRNIVQHLDLVKPNMLNVGGWFDAEDLWGPLNIYQTLEQKVPGSYNALVMGPFSHGDWARKSERQAVGNIFFGTYISDYYQYNIERPFFNHFLRGVGTAADLPAEATVYDTGERRWDEFDHWPPQNSRKLRFFLRDEQELNTGEPTRSEAEYTQYLSDPNKPVPSSEDIEAGFTPRKYMTDDQRFAARRPDVLVFESDVLDADITFAGPILANLLVSTTGTDADWVVKLIDVFPPAAEDTEEMQDHLTMGNYHMMVRSEVMRGRYRNSFSNPEPFRPNEVTTVRVPLQDVYHTFKKGHKIQIQVQSTWFPLIDRNPQTFVPNIFDAKESDFQAQLHRVYHAPAQASYVEVTVLQE